MKVSFEYGQGMVDAVLPDSTDIFIPGDTCRIRPVFRKIN